MTKDNQIETMPEIIPMQGTQWILKWLLGLFSVIVGGVMILFATWMVTAIVANATEVRLINARLAGVELRLDKMDLDMRREKVKP